MQRYKFFEQYSTYRVTSCNPFCGAHQVEFMGAYGVSKTSLLGLTKVMALELGPRGIRVNCICPGLIETRFGEVVKQKLMITIIKILLL